MKKVCVILVFLVTSAVHADVLTATWNIRWFPSGRAEHRAPPEVEKATIQGAAEVVRSELAKRRKPSDHVILFFQELRDLSVCSNFVERIGDKKLSVASVSAFRDYDRRLGWQQCGIVSDLPVVDASFSYWRRTRKILPPRGFVYALLDGGADGLIACYCVHLKSNYGATTPERRAANRQKRELAMEQFRSLTKKVLAPDGQLVQDLMPRIRNKAEVQAYIEEHGEAADGCGVRQLLCRDAAGGARYASGYHALSGQHARLYLPPWLHVSVRLRAVAGRSPQRPSHGVVALEMKGYGSRGKPRHFCYNNRRPTEHGEQNGGRKAEFRGCAEKA